MRVGSVWEYELYLVTEQSGQRLTNDCHTLNYTSRPSVSRLTNKYLTIFSLWGKDSWRLKASENMSFTWSQNDQANDFQMPIKRYLLPPDLHSLTWTSNTRLISFPDLKRYLLWERKSSKKTCYIKTRQDTVLCYLQLLIHPQASLNDPWISVLWEQRAFECTSLS